MKMWRAAVVLAASVLILGACTDDEPDPLIPDAAPEEEPESSSPSGLRVGVVLPPGDPEEDRPLSALRADLRSVATTLPDGVHSMRLLVPDGRDFVRDLTQLLVEDGLDIVCVMGRDGRRTIREFAETHPGQRYCAVPAAASEPPSGKTLVAVRFEELGHVVGRAALAAAGDGPVGAVVGMDRVGRTAFLDGLEAAVGDDRLLLHGPSDPEGALEAVEEVVAAGAEVIIVDVGVGGLEAVEAAASQAQVLAPASIPPTDETLVSWRVRWDVILRPVLEHYLEEEVEVPESFGLAEDALVVVSEDQAPLAVQGIVNRVVADLRAGELDPLEPVQPEGDEDDEPDDDDDDGQDDESVDDES